MNYTFTQFELKSLLIEAAEMGAKKALLEVGAIKPVMSKREAYRMINQATVDRAIENGTLKTTKKGGVTSKVWIDRKSFYDWIFTNELASTPVIKK